MFKVGDKVHVGFVGTITAQELVKFNLGKVSKVVSRVTLDMPDGSTISAYVTEEALSYPLEVECEKESEQGSGVVRNEPEV
jgi:molybdopterin-binding protein